MADWATKIQKQAGPLLLATEEVVAGVLAKPTGTLDSQIGWMPGGWLGAISARILQRSSRDRSPEAASTIAASFPESQCVLGMSRHRLMAFGHGSLLGKVTELASSVNLTDIDDISMRDDPVGATLLVSFGDGSTKSYEVIDPAKLNTFVAAFHTLKERPAGT